MSNSGNMEVTGKDIFVMIIRYLLCLIFPPVGGLRQRVWHDAACLSVYALRLAARNYFGFSYLHQG